MPTIATTAREVAVLDDGRGTVRLTYGGTLIDSWAYCGPAQRSSALRDADAAAVLARAAIRVAADVEAHRSQADAADRDAQTPSFRDPPLER